MSFQESNATGNTVDCRKFCRHIGELRRIRERLDRMATYASLKTARQTDQDKADAVSQERHALTKIVDRLLLNITVICIVLAIIWVIIYGVNFPTRAHAKRTIH